MKNFIEWFLRLFRKPQPTPQPVLFDPIKQGYTLKYYWDFVNSIFHWGEWDWREPWSLPNDTTKGITKWDKSCVTQHGEGLHLFVFLYGGWNECGMICGHPSFRVQPNSCVSVTAKVAPKGFLYFCAPGWLYGNHEQEIDIAEFMGKESDEVCFTHHWKDTTHQAEGITWKSPVDLSLDFHTYMVEWTPTRLTWFIDGIQRYTTTNNIPTEEMYFISNIQSGGVEGAFNHLFTKDEVPMSMIIREVRVWQR